MKRAAFLICASVAVLSSCSLDYGQSRLSSEFAEEIPDTVLTGVVHTVVRDHTVRFRITAARVEAFTDENRQNLFEVGFTEFGSDGAIRTEGTADYADFNTETEDVELTGNLRFFSVPDEAWLKADILYWASADRLLSSDPQEPVVLEKSDGTFIVGRGFAAEMSESLIIFSGGVRGIIVDEE